MQLYDFQCSDCSHVFEDWDNMDRTARPPCPECHSPETSRLISKPRLDYTGMVTSGRDSDDGMTTAIDKWAKARSEKKKIEERNLRNHGTED